MLAASKRSRQPQRASTLPVVAAGRRETHQTRRGSMSSVRGKWGTTMPTPTPAKLPAITPVGKCLPARTRSTDTKVESAVASASVIHDRAARGERAKAR